MAIYTYECGEHGVCDVLVQGANGPGEEMCSVCGDYMRNVLTAPAVINVDRDWNDEANDYQTHGPYHQARAQLENISRRAAEGGESHSPITEEAIQVGAKAIHEQATAPLGPSIEEKYVKQIRGNK